MAAALELSGVVKDYHALRPLRIERLTLAFNDHAAIVGVDQHSAEVLINLITGATLPDAGDIQILGRPSASISDAAEWLALVDRFGIVSERAVLLDSMSVIQNLAMPFSLDIEPPSGPLRARAITLAQETGIPERDWDRRLGDLESAARLRVRLARALALDPEIVLLEHPSAALARSEVASVARGIRAVLERRPRLASLTLTADAEFADHVAAHVLVLDPASGRLSERGRGWFGRRRG